MDSSLLVVRWVPCYVRSFLLLLLATGSKVPQHPLSSRVFARQLASSNSKLDGMRMDECGGNFNRHKLEALVPLALEKSARFLSLTRSRSAWAPSAVT